LGREFQGLKLRKPKPGYQYCWAVNKPTGTKVRYEIADGVWEDYILTDGDTVEGRLKDGWERVDG
jgi:hypothetical protein